MDTKHEDKLRNDEPAAEADSVTPDQKKPKGGFLRVKTGIKGEPYIRNR